MKSYYVKNRTQSQINFCNSLKIRKPRVKKEYAIKTTRIEYMNNCIYWMDQYLNGKSSIDRAKSAISSLETHISEFKKEHIELNNPKP